jgi:BTB/POZ domain
VYLCLLILSGIAQSVSVSVLCGSFSPSSTLCTSQNTEPFAFRALLEYVYRGQVQLTLETALEVFVTANRYQLHLLEQHCVHFLSENVNSQSCVSLLEVALKLVCSCTDGDRMCVCVCVCVCVCMCMRVSCLYRCGGVSVCVFLFLAPRTSLFPVPPLPSYSGCTHTHPRVIPSLLAGIRSTRSDRIR